MTSLSIAILGDPRGWHARRLLEAANQRGHSASIVPWETMGTEVVTGGSTAEERFDPPALTAAEVIVVRGMPGASLRDRPGGGLEEILFRMNLLGRLEASGRRVVNRPRSLEIAIDKHLSLAMLARAGIPVPRTILAQAPGGIRAAWESLGRDAVVKPLFGSGGHGLRRLTHEGELETLLASHRDGDVVFLQEFVRHPGWDVRALVIGGAVHTMRRSAAPGEWRTNLALGGRGTPFRVPAAWTDLALRASITIGTDVAGIDLLPMPDGSAVVCEVNAVPGWRGLASALSFDPSINVIGFLEG